MQSEAVGPQAGKVVRLAPDRRFGYVSNSASQYFIFVVGTAISNRDAAKLRVGSEVRYEVVGQGRVERLVVDGTL